MFDSKYYTRISEVNYKQVAYHYFLSNGANGVKIKPDDIVKLQDAIARDVESISFVEKYARETGGSKKALEKIKNGVGAKI